MHTLSHTVRSSRPATGFAAARPSTVFGTVLVWLERAAQRRALGEMEDRVLTDIGVSRADAEEESRKPFWRA